jgi:osmotically-inducible protein OsmY
MKISFSRWLRRSKWHLVTAGAIGLGGTTFGQSSSVPLSRRSAEAPGDKVGRLKADDLLERRRMEMRVEIAWLADPVTFPCHLEAHVTHEALEARGYVTDSAVREKALKIAREVSGKRVVDATRYHRARSRPVLTRPETAVQRDAVRLLRQVHPVHATTVKVETQPNGRLVVEGTLASLEDKFAVSRCLSHVGGCKCVDNQLRALDESVPEPLIAEKKEPSDRPIENKSQSDPRLLQVILSRRVPTANVTVIPGPNGTMVVTGSVDRTGDIEILMRAAGDMVGGRERVTNALRLRQGPPEVARIDIATTKQETTKTTSVKQSYSLVQHLQPAEVSSAAPVKHPEKETTIWIGSSPEPQAPERPAKQPSPAVLVLNQPKPTSVQSKIHGSTQTVAVKKPVSETKKITTPAAEPYVTTGVILIERQEEPARPAKPLLAFSQLQRCIASACRKKPGDVEIKPLSASKLSVRVKASGFDEGDRLKDKIFGLPELAPYQIDLDIVVGR